MLASFIVSLLVTAQIKATPLKNAPTGWDPLLYMGRTPQEIVELGREKWCQQHAELIGKTPSDMANANFKFEKAQRVLNLQSVSKLPTSEQIWIKKLRSEALAYGRICQEVIFSSSDSLPKSERTILRSKVGADMEQLLADCINKKNSAKRIDLTFQSIFDTINNALNIEDAESTKAIKKLTTKHRQFLKFTKSGTPSNQMRVITFMKIYLRDITLILTSFPEM